MDDSGKVWGQVFCTVCDVNAPLHSKPSDFKLKFEHLTIGDSSHVLCRGGQASGGLPPSLRRNPEDYQRLNLWSRE